MRTLKYAILGLLNQKEMTGYDLMKQFESTLCEFWSAKHSQIYPELKKLTEEGASLIRRSLLTTKPQPTPKDISRLKIFFCNCLPAEDRKFLLEDQLHKHSSRLKHLRNNQSKFTAVPDNEADEFGDYLVLMGAIMREEMVIEWLRKCLALLG